MTDGSRKLDSVKVCLCGDPAVGKTYSKYFNMNRLLHYLLNKLMTDERRKLDIVKVCLFGDPTDGKTCIKKVT